MEPCEGGSLLMTEYDGDARLEASAYPLIVFVHVPKTAGSTIKKLLSLCTPGGNINVQFLMDDRDVFLDIARNSHWIGGNCRRNRFVKRLTLTDMVQPSNRILLLRSVFID